MRSVLLLLLVTSLGAALAPQDYPAVPRWVLVGIAMVETSSYYDEAGTIHYVNHGRGDGLSRGCFQLTEPAFDSVARPGEEFEEMTTDNKLAESIACRYIGYLYVTLAHHSWDEAVARYRCGGRWRGHTGQAYLARAKAAGQCDE